MFGKLMKYEMRSLMRGLLPLYGAVLIMAAVNAVMMNFMQYGLPQTIAIMLYFGLCVAVAVLTIMAMVQRFYKGLLCDEGYLMHTLPVRPWELLLSKLTGATIMTILSGVIGILSIFVLMCFDISVGDMIMVGWSELFRESFRVFPTWPLAALLWLLSGVAYVTSQITQLYAAMSLGHLSNRHRVAMSFVWYMVISTALSILLALGIHLIGATGLDYWISQMLSTLQPTAAMYVTVLGILVFYLIKTAAFFAVSNFVLSHKLNLE